jgi:CBS domain-containing protein
MEAKDVMTREPACCTPSTPARDAAAIMEEQDCGCVPVVDDDQRLRGVVTDRDLALRGVARGSGPDTPVEELMTTPAVCCGTNTDLNEATRTLAEHQIRRVPVIDANERVVGIVAQADLANARARIGNEEVADTVGAISQPTDSASQVPPGGPGPIRP